jgi:hypothetical protein
VHSDLIALLALGAGNHEVESGRSGGFLPQEG